MLASLTFSGFLKFLQLKLLRQFILNGRMPAISAHELQPATVFTATGERCGPSTIRPITKEPASYSNQSKPTLDFTCSLSWRLASPLASSCVVGDGFSSQSQRPAGFILLVLIIAHRFLKPLIDAPRSEPIELSFWCQTAARR